MNPILSAAQSYLARGWTPIPCGKDKVPLIKWQEFQTRRPTPEELDSLFTPDTNIGIVTGKMSDLSVIDIDTDEGWKIFQENLGDEWSCPTVLTPSGGRHLYCRHYEGLRNNVRALPGVDLRSEGGYVVCPPSQTASGGKWVWAEKLGPTTPIPSLPEFYIKAIYDNVILPGDERWAAKKGEVMTEGRRNEDLFHIVWKMVKGGERGDKLATIAHDLGKLSGLSRAEVDHILKSALERAAKPDRNMAEEAKLYILGTDGEFGIRDLIAAIGGSEKDKKALRQAISRFKKDGLIEKSGHKDGMYRRIDQSCEAVDWKNAPTNDMDLDWPLGLGELVSIFPRNIVILAGQSNSGKTAYLLDFTRRNMDKYEVHYFSSEMGGTEAHVRIGKRDDLPIDAWKFNLWDRSFNFGDVIRPNAINIVDYLESLEAEEYKVKAYISQIWNKLDKGIALIAIQKNKGRDVGRGGEATMDRARLYVALEHGVAKIVKAKNWKGTENPNGKIIKFKLFDGWKFVDDGVWRHPEDEQAAEEAFRTMPEPHKKARRF